MSSAAGVTFTVLGRLEVRRDGTRLDLGRPKQRLLLAMLLCHANTPVRVERLTEALWDGHPPRTARKNLQGYVAALRKIIDPRIHYEAYGYRVDVHHDELDLTRFQGLAATARQLRRRGEQAAAAVAYRAAVECWQPPVRCDFGDTALALRESERINTALLSVYEEWVDVALSLGREAEVVDQIAAVADQFPFRDRLGVARMIALARCGRTAEGVAYYDEVCRRLARELGVGPSPMLRAGYEQIIAGRVERPTGSVRRAARTTPGARCLLDLPSAPIDVVGRVTEVDRIVKAVARSSGARSSGARSSGAGSSEAGSSAREPVVLVTGPPGVGKTIIALQAAHRLAAEFPAGVRFQAAERIRCPSGAFPERRQGLLVLDGVDDVATIAALRATPGDGCALVTSRLMVGELAGLHRISLGAFSTAEALALLSTLIGEGRMVDDRHGARLLAERCGRLPMAVRIVGTRLAMSPGLSLREYADRLTDDDALFAELSIGGLSLGASFDDCLRGLPAQGVQALRRLSALPEPCFRTVDAQRALTGLTQPAAWWWRRLREHNLIVAVRPAEYALAPLLHRYVARCP